MWLPRIRLFQQLGIRIAYSSVQENRLIGAVLRRAIVMTIGRVLPRSAGHDPRRARPTYRVLS